MQCKHHAACLSLRVGFRHEDSTGGIQRHGGLCAESGLGESRQRALQLAGSVVPKRASAKCAQKVDCVKQCNNETQ
jgi:hypothetical protein